MNVIIFSRGIYFDEGSYPCTVHAALHMLVGSLTMVGSLAKCLRNLRKKSLFVFVFFVVVFVILHFPQQKTSYVSVITSYQTVWVLM